MGSRKAERPLPNEEVWRRGTGLKPEQVVPEEERRNRHEFPFSSYYEKDSDRSAFGADRTEDQHEPTTIVDLLDGFIPSPTPATVVQAVMEAAPGDEPRTSIEELVPLRELLVSVLETLSPRDQRIVDLFVVQGLSIRKAADELGMAKSHVHRLREQVFQRLREALINEPLVRERLVEGASLEEED